MRIDVKWRQEGDIAIASILGRIDSLSSDRFQALLEEGLSSGPRALLMDFERKYVVMHADVVPYRSIVSCKAMYNSHIRQV